MNDPVTNALAVQMEYGNEELQRDIEIRIRTIAVDVLNKMASDPEFMRRLIVNNTYEFNAQVLRALKDFLNHPRSIY
jgi:hypothetical protein